MTTTATLTAPRADPLLLRADDAAALLAMSRRAFYRAVSAGLLPAAVDAPGGRKWRATDLRAAVTAMRPARGATR